MDWKQELDTLKTKLYQQGIQDAHGQSRDHQRYIELFNYHLLTPLIKNDLMIRSGYQRTDLDWFTQEQLKGHKKNTIIRAIHSQLIIRLREGTYQTNHPTEYSEEWKNGYGEYNQIDISKYHRQINNELEHRMKALNLPAQIDSQSETRADEILNEFASTYKEQQAQSYLKESIAKLLDNYEQQITTLSNQLDQDYIPQETIQEAQQLAHQQVITLFEQEKSHFIKHLSL